MPPDPFRRVIDDFDAQAGHLQRWSADAEEDETLRLLEAAIARFAERELDDARIDAQAAIPPEVIAAAAEMGLFGISIAPEYGGAGLSMKACSRVVGLLGRADRSFGVSVGLHAGLGLRGLNQLGSPEQKQRYLPQLASGERIACFSITESEAGSDIASMRTTAVADGDGLRLNGSKIYVTNGGFGSLATIVARTPELGGSRRGHSMLLVPLESEGVSRDAEEHKLGIRGSSTCSLHFEDVRLPLDHVLGEPARGLDHMALVLTWGRTLMAAGCIGIAEAALERAAAHVCERVQFKRPIAEFGMVREKLAVMRARIHAMESLVRLVTRLEDERPDSIVWESSVAKIVCSELVWQVVDEALQLHGGSGFIEETGMARLLRDCRITRIFEGANELLRYHMASAALTWKPAAMVEGPRLAPRMGELLADEAAAFDGLLSRLAERLASEKKAHGLKVFKRQMMQRRVADAACGLYTLLALLLRARGAAAAGTLDEATLRWTQYGAVLLCAEVERQLDAAAGTSDALASRIAADECARLGLDLEETIA